VSKVIVGNKQSHCNLVKHKFMLKDLHGIWDESVPSIEMVLGLDVTEIV
jgi:hypothetical protein